MPGKTNYVLSNILKMEIHYHVVCWLCWSLNVDIVTEKDSVSDTSTFIHVI